MARLSAGRRASTSYAAGNAEALLQRVLRQRDAIRDARRRSRQAGRPYARRCARRSPGQPGAGRGAPRDRRHREGLGERLAALVRRAGAASLTAMRTTAPSARAAAPPVRAVLAGVVDQVGEQPLEQQRVGCAPASATAAHRPPAPCRHPSLGNHAARDGSQVGMLTAVRRSPPGRGTADQPVSHFGVTAIASRQKASGLDPRAAGRRPCGCAPTRAAQVVQTPASGSALALVALVALRQLVVRDCYRRHLGRAPAISAAVTEPWPPVKSGTYAGAAAPAGASGGA